VVGVIRALECGLLGVWTLVNRVVVPAFRFGGFELAPPGSRPSGCGDPGTTV
jgi:predicted cupin superfamily sugar epimerase